MTTATIPDPLRCVLFDAGGTLLGPAPGFEGTGRSDGGPGHRVRTLTELVDPLGGEA